MQQIERAGRTPPGRRRGAAALVAILAAACASCDDEPVIEPDLPDPWEVAPPAPAAEPEPPAVPELPRLVSWTCAEGWRSVVHEEALDETGEPFSWCEPAPIPRLRAGDHLTALEDGEGEGERPICDPAVDGTYPVVGHANCQPLGDACPDGDFPDVPASVTGRRIYVLDGAVGGDGSEGAPWATIAEALSSAGDGDVVVVGAGVYHESLVLDRDVTLWGRCVRDTVIDGLTTPPDDPFDGATVVIATGVTATLRNLRVGGLGYGVAIRRDAVATIEGVWVHGTAGVGVYAYAPARLELSRALVSSVSNPPPSEPSGAAVYAKGISTARDGEVSLRELTVEGAPNGLLTGDVDAVALEDVAVRHTDPRYGSAGRAWEVWSVLEAEGSRLVFEDCVSGGLEYTSARSARTALRLEDVVVRRSRLDPAALAVTHGALMFYAAADVTLTRALLEDNVDSGMQALDGVSLVAEDVVVRRSGSANPEREEGAAVVAVRVSALDEAPALTLRRALLDENAKSSVYLVEAGRAELTDLWIEDTATAPAGDLGYGVYLGLADEALLTRALVQRSGEYGLVVEASTRAIVEDLTVRDTQGRYPETAGVGLLVELAPEVEIRRALVSTSRVVGFSAAATTLTVEDLAVEDTGVGGDDVSYGSILLEGAVATMRRVRFERNERAALYVSGPATAAAIEDLTVLDTTSACDLGLCFTGIGAWAEAGATLELARARLEGSTVHGLLVEGNGTSVVAADLSVAGTLEAGSADFSPAGVLVRDGASIELARAAVDANAGVGVRIDGAGTTAVLADVDIGGTTPFTLATGLSAGLAVSDEAVATATRARVSGSSHLGVLVDGAARLELDSALIEATLGRDDGRFGRGLEVEEGAVVAVRSSQLVGNRDVALAIFGPETAATLERVLVADTAQRGCVDLDGPSSCEAGRGHGLGVYDGAAVEIADVEVRGAAGAGLQLAGGGRIDGAGLAIHGCAVGVDLEGTTRAELDAGLEALLLANNEADVAAAATPAPERAPR
jgi:hypothetical protein